MIVKNEERIIERCLQSVKGIVDYVSICDTGSTDRTVEVIEKFLADNQIPGKVFHHTWKNFGYNRTASFLAAQEMLREFNVPLEKSYMLLLDADMVLQVAPDFKKEHLDKDGYLLLQTNPFISYYNTRVIRGSLPWRSIGVTHEYWGAALSQETEKLQTLWIDDREDGGCKADKFERDIRLLTEGLQEEPHNVRYMFYLAQSYKCSGKLQEALLWYKKRIQAGGWKEEVWYSKMMIAECYEEMDFWEHALHWYLEAFQTRPERAEPLKKISLHYRLKGDNALSYLFAKQGSQIPYPQEDLLFVSHPVYNYEFLEDLSIVSFYTGHQEEGFEAVNRLSLKKELPNHVREQAYNNMLFYVKNLDGARFLPIPLTRPTLNETSEERYYAMNPSIQKVEGGYEVLCRTVNFSQKGGADYRSRDPLDPTIRTRNFLVQLDREYQLLSQQEIVESVEREKTPSQVQGMEDCRLFHHHSKSSFLCTLFDHEPGKVVQALGTIVGGQLGPLIPLKGKKGCEKNWLPFVDKGHLYAIYSPGYSGDPFTLYEIDMERGEIQCLKEWHPPLDFSRFRGSAAPIPYKEGYLMLVHEVTFQHQRIYTHRFLYLDGSYTPTKLSKPFTFQHQGIEYCCGMTSDHQNEELILSIGIEDKEALLCILKLDAVEALLEPLY